VGRTGTFIVIDSMLERIKHVDTVDIYGHVTCLRAQRNYMVQTEDQYMFIHEAVLEAVTAGNTEILARQLRSHVRQLTTTPLNHQQNALQLEFQVHTTGGAVRTGVTRGRSQTTVASLGFYQLTFTFAVWCRPSVCHLSVVCITLMLELHLTQAVVIFGNISTAFGKLAIP